LSEVEGRHIITDINGFLVHAIVDSGDIQDRDGAPLVPGDIRSSFLWLRPVFADGGYAGDKRKTALTKIDSWTIEIIKRPDVAKPVPCKANPCDRSQRR
jgi:hypothetical protein